MARMNDAFARCMSNDKRSAIILGALLVTTGCKFRHGTYNVQPPGADSPNSYVCHCDCGSQQLSAQQKVIAGADDAEETLSTGGMIVGGNALDMTLSGTQLVAVRFAGGIPKGATIVAANIHFVATGTDNVTTDLTIEGEANSAALAFSSTASNISNRARTTAKVAWSPPAWVGGDSGEAENTNNLAPIVQELVDRPDWSPSSAMVFIISGTGNRSAASFERSSTNAALLSISYQEPVLSLDLPVCMTSGDDPNLSGSTPSTDELTADCTGRVQTTLSGLAGACGYPSQCTCSFQDAQKFVSVCDSDCTPNPVNVACTNFDPPLSSTATNFDGDAPVCIVHNPPQLATFLFAQRSQCDVKPEESHVTFASGDDSESSKAHGTMDIIGSPGQASVGVAYRLTMDDVTFGNFFESATFGQLAGVGDSSQDAALASDGTGAFAANSTESSGRGRRDNGDVLALVGPNSSVLNVTVDWGGKTCHLDGSLLGNVDPEEAHCENAGPNANQVCHTNDDCGTDPSCSGDQGVCLCQTVPSADTNMGLVINGTLENQPPTANAGPDQTIECNQSGGATFTLDGRGSTDPDGNFASIRWFTGSRTGPVAGSLALIQVQQTLGGPSNYILRVLDTFGQGSEDTTVAQVVDTTPPVVACNAPATIRPITTPLAFVATATDICDPSVIPTILPTYQCFKISNGIKVKDPSCKMTPTGNVMVLKHSEGYGTHFQWTIRGVDDSGNAASALCEVVVTKS
jgi:hypothetical protein